MKIKATFQAAVNDIFALAKICTYVTVGYVG